MFSSFYGSSLLSTANALTAALSYSSSPFSGTATGIVSGSSPFALTEVVLISGATAANSQTSFDFMLSTVPDGGSTLILLGSAMTALTMIRSRSGKK